MAHGCFDILHGGHLEYFSQAKSIGDYLIVCIASDESLWLHKNKKPSIPLQHRVKIIQSLSMVDEVVVSSGTKKGIDFEPELRRIVPDILVATEDDKYRVEKIQLCEELGVIYEQLPKTLEYERVSTSDIINFIKAPLETPLRIDFAGGWLDTPKLSRLGGVIVNCTISPLVSLRSWTYNQSSGLGGSAAYAILTGKNAIDSELALGVGWQDPAVIQETGLCVWESGQRPTLKFKRTPTILKNKLALLWTGESHYTPGLTDKKRDYEKIFKAGKLASIGVLNDDIIDIFYATQLSYEVQLGEGMKKLPAHNESAKKYCGGGFGGYALYIFLNEADRIDFLKNENTVDIQPYIRETL